MCPPWPYAILASVTRPFTPRDTLRLRNQQDVGTALDLETAVLLGQSPLRQAISGYLPLGNRGVQTLVLDSQDGSTPHGFVQARRCLDGTEADLTFIAPSLAAANGAALSWQRLISGACQWLGGQGTQRIFAAIEENDRVALQVLRHLGFVAYTSETVFRHPADSTPPAAPEGMVVMPAGARMTSAVHRLACLNSPDSIQANAGAPGGDWGRYPLGGRAPGAVSARVWLDKRGEVIGAWRLIAGRSGHWLQVLTSPGTEAGPPIRRALSDAAAGGDFPARPVYTTASAHEPGLNLALRQNGFEPVLGRLRLVKHTAVRVLEPEWRRRKLREHGLDPAPTRSAPLTEAAGSEHSAAHPRR